MTLHFKATAESDFFEIVAGYDSIGVRLAEDFASVVFKRLDQILEFPELAPRLSKHIRKINLGRFPYQLIYQVREDEIWVIAIWHNKRKPGSWENRS